MTELLTAAQMRAIEQAAIESGEVTGLELMERAGQGVVDAILEWRPELALTSHRAVVLCGPGNNGGDGFVVARLLKKRGWGVNVFLYGEEAKLPPDAAENCRRWRELGDIRSIWKPKFDLTIGDKSDLVVDALFGTGLSRPIASELVFELSQLQLKLRDYFDPDLTDWLVVAVDVPSGLCADSGRTLQTEFRLQHVESVAVGNSLCLEADLTVTFHRKKLGHVVGTGPSACGKVSVTEIGLEQRLERFRNTATETSQSVMPLTKPSPTVFRYGDEAHKYDYGHALILSGPCGKGGAARLAARGALRIGAGLVTVGCPPGALQENAARLDAVMLQSIKDAAQLSDVLEDDRINAVCLGPGMGVTERTKAMVLAILATQNRAVVLDADALTVFKDDPETLFAASTAGTVLTPHAGEFARLFPDIAEKLNAPATKGPAYSKVDATREAAARSGAIVLFKGADTVIANPDGHCAINSAHYDRAAPWLATAGSGDVLAGFITGLLARGFDPMKAAQTAAWLHVECALKFGPGLIAEDLPEQLPAVFRDLGL